MDKSELERLAATEGVPADFDAAQINWKANYDPYYYQQLCQRAERVYLYQDRYIFLTQNAVIVETPQAGHATYIFSRPQVDLLPGRTVRVGTLNSLLERVIVEPQPSRGSIESNTPGQPSPPRPKELRATASDACESHASAPSAGQRLRVEQKQGEVRVTF